MRSEDARFHRNVGLLALAFTVCRLLAARWIHLTEDEAYYRLWAQHLHLGYYDHPPMIAWWIRAGSVLAGDNPLGVRLLPVLAAGLATWLVADLTRALGGKPATGLRAAVWYNATITIGLGGILATPDAPATLFWVLTLWTLGKVAANPRWWMLAGATAGLACISKYSALFLAPGVLLWLCLTPQGRKALATPWPWTAVGVAGLIFSTNVFWNAQHGWLTFAKQFGRVEPHAFRPDRMADLLVTQFFLLNPLIAIYAGKGALRAWRERDDPAAVQLILPLATGLPFAAYLVLHSLHDRVQAHWPVPLFAGFAILAAVAVERSAAGRTARIARASAIGLGLALSAVTLTYMATAGNKAIGRLDPMLALRGWPQFAQSVERVRLREGAAWVGTVGYGTYSQLVAADIVQAPMLQVIERPRYGDPAPAPDASRPGLVVDLARRLDARTLATCFATVTYVGEIARGAEGGPPARYAAYRVTGPKVDLMTQGCPDDLGKKKSR
ncbi:MAG TPA: glycosyltransferase family 39 protein [Phenylobacterium sp.]|nr:glycosyltransferase family 39 protein [Phenylobacterium sp.]